MIRNEDRSLSNREVFCASLPSGPGPTRARRILNRFYDEQFPSLQEVTELRPWAARTVRRVIGRVSECGGDQSLFPLRAIEHRLAWRPAEGTICPGHQLREHARDQAQPCLLRGDPGAGRRGPEHADGGRRLENDVPAAPWGCILITAGDAEPPEPGVSPAPARWTVLHLVLRRAGQGTTGLLPTTDAG